jgi:hypothetical protein
MTEAEWLASDDLDDLLGHVCELRRSELRITNPLNSSEERRSKFPARIYPRKRRLFHCACCRRIWRLIPDVVQQTIDVAERFADGVASDAARREAMAKVEAVGKTYAHRRMPGWSALLAVGGAVRLFTDSPYCCTSFVMDFDTWPFLNIDDDDGGFSFPADCARNALMLTEDAAVLRDAYIRWRSPHPRLFAEDGLPVEGTHWYAELQAQCNLLRDIFGNPFRPVAVDPSWKTANVIGIAQAIYDERRFGELPILADALEDAGCANADVLGHCRQPGEHVRGCWVVDLILGKGD